MARRKKEEVETVQQPVEPVGEVLSLRLPELPTTLYVDDEDFNLEQLREYNFEDKGVFYKDGRKIKVLLVASRK